MKHLLARLGAAVPVGVGADHRAVFAAFARGLMSALRRPASHARVRVVRG
jgi:hypothetical protein